MHARALVLGYHDHNGTFLNSGKYFPRSVDANPSGSGRVKRATIFDLNSNHIFCLYN